MGKGKGGFDHWAARVAVNQIVLELKGMLHEQVARDAFRLAGNKLPGKQCVFIDPVREANLFSRTMGVRQERRAPCGRYHQAGWSYSGGTEATPEEGGSRNNYAGYTSFRSRGCSAASR